jgi:site-specific DNA-cytosine methylase
MNALCDYLEKHASVQMIILENVPGLLSQTIAGSPYGALKKRLEGLGPPCKKLKLPIYQEVPCSARM